jgi:hypothetical protein
MAALKLTNSKLKMLNVVEELNEEIEEL